MCVRCRRVQWLNCVTINAYILFRTQTNTINLLTDTISLTTNKGKLVSVLKFISNIDVRSGGEAPRILAEQVVPSVNIFDSRSGGTVRSQHRLC